MWTRRRATADEASGLRSPELTVNRGRRCYESLRQLLQRPATLGLEEQQREHTYLHLGAEERQDRRSRRSHFREVYPSKVSDENGHGYNLATSSFSDATAITVALVGRDYSPDIFQRS
jgi:hypothetical protein